jgi:hypothetical protein
MSMQIYWYIQSIYNLITKSNTKNSSNIKLDYTVTEELNLNQVQISQKNNYTKPTSGKQCSSKLACISRDTFKSENSLN